MDDLREITGEYIAYQTCLHHDDTMDFPCLEVSDLYCVGMHTGVNSCDYNTCHKHNAQTISASSPTADAHIYLPDRQTEHELVALSILNSTCLHPRRRDGEPCREIDEVLCTLCGWQGCLDCAMNTEEHRPSASIHLGWTLPSDSAQSDASVNKPVTEGHGLDWVLQRAVAAREEADATMAKVMAGAGSSQK